MAPTRRLPDDEGYCSSEERKPKRQKTEHVTSVGQSSTPDPETGLCSLMAKMTLHERPPPPTFPPPPPTFPPPSTSPPSTSSPSTSLSSTFSPPPSSSPPILIVTDDRDTPSLIEKRLARAVRIGRDAAMWEVARIMREEAQAGFEPVRVHDGFIHPLWQSRKAKKAYFKKPDWLHPFLNRNIYLRDRLYKHL